jgi:hypothetical protein
MLSMRCVDRWLVAVDAVGGSMRFYDGSEELVACCSRQGSQRRRRCRTCCSRCRRRIDALVQSSRLTEEETKRLFAVVKAHRGGDDALVAVVKAHRGGDDALDGTTARRSLSLVQSLVQSSRLTGEETTRWLGAWLGAWLGESLAFTRGTVNQL